MYQIYVGYPEGLTPEGKPFDTFDKARERASLLHGIFIQERYVINIERVNKRRLPLNR